LYTVSPEGYRGFFTNVQNGTLKNFFIQGTVKGRENSAGVACTATNENFENIVCDVDVFTTNYYKNVSSGGLIGIYFADAEGEEFTIKNCVNNGSITSNNFMIAGLVGSAGLTEGTSLVMENCVNQGYVYADAQSTEDDQCIAGIVSNLGSYGNYTLRNCSNEAEVYGTDVMRVAGVVGYASGASTTIDSCVNSGAITTGTLNEWAVASGIVGGTGSQSVVPENCSNTGELTTYNGITVDIVDRVAK
jgi:hypothetical protein